MLIHHPTPPLYIRRSDMYFVSQDSRFLNVPGNLKPLPYLPIYLSIDRSIYRSIYGPILSYAMLCSAMLCYLSIYLHMYIIHTYIYIYIYIIYIYIITGLYYGCNEIPKWNPLVIQVAADDPEDQGAPGAWNARIHLKTESAKKGGMRWEFQERWCSCRESGRV